MQPINPRIHTPPLENERTNLHDKVKEVAMTLLCVACAEICLAGASAIYGAFMGSLFSNTKEISFKDTEWVALTIAGSIAALTFPPALWISTSYGKSRPLLSDAMHVVNWTAANGIVWGSSHLLGPLTKTQALACFGIFSLYGLVEKGESLFLRGFMDISKRISLLTLAAKVMVIWAMAAIPLICNYMTAPEGAAFAFMLTPIPFMATALKCLQYENEE